MSCKAEFREFFKVFQNLTLRRVLFQGYACSWKGQLKRAVEKNEKSESFKLESFKLESLKLESYAEVGKFR